VSSIAHKRERGPLGTSAGAMNAAVLVDGLVRGGLEQARAELQKYWEAVGEMPGLGTLFSNISGEKAATTPLESIPAYVEAMKKNLSPYDLPLANDNPMRRLLTDLIDFDRLRSQKEIQLTVCATNARTVRSATIQRFGWNSARLRSCCVFLMRRGRHSDVYDFTLSKLARSWKDFRCRASLTTTRHCLSICSI
jgi:predicted acylesterase/phospholipase RssA